MQTSCLLRRAHDIRAPYGGAQVAAAMRGSCCMTDRSAAHAELGVLCAAHGFIGIAVGKDMLVTSVNFSWSAENASLKFGVVDPNLPEAVEPELRGPFIYQATSIEPSY
jgi:hypothetical protein